MAATAPVLPPGFRFHPTDHELVDYYLRGKIQGLQMQLVIPEIELCKVDPWELPDTGMSFLAGRCDHQECYFYSQRFPRYGKTGTRINRSTPSGYWKSTGKDRSVHGEHATIGYKKTLVYLHGRAHHGQRTDWAMHEYRLDDTQDAYALYRLYKRKGTNPSPDVPGTAAADEEDASRQVVPAVAAVGAEDTPMPFATSGAAVGAVGAPMQFAASGAAVGAEGAPMQFAASGAAVNVEGAPIQFVDSAAIGTKGAPMQFVGVEGTAWNTNAQAEEKNSWMEFTSDDAWYTNIDMDKDDFLMQFSFNDVWYRSEALIDKEQ